MFLWVSFVYSYSYNAHHGVFIEWGMWNYAPPQFKTREDVKVMQNADVLTKVRTLLLLDQPFIGQLASFLKLEFDDKVDTAYTDGEKIGVNHKFFEKLLHKERTGIMAHEVFHVMLLHHVRRQPWMEQRTYQIAIDIIVNGMCLENGFTLPKDGILPETWEGGVSEYWDLSKKSVEQVYKILEDKKANNPEMLPDNPKEKSTGECRDHPSKSNTPSSEGDKSPQEKSSKDAVSHEEQRVKTIVAQAYQNAKRQGAISASMERAVKEILQPRIKWCQRIAKEITSRSKTKHVWPPFNRRWVHEGIYLHAMQGESIGNVVWATDTSGSVDQPTLDEINAELRGLSRSYDGEFTCLGVDSKVRSSQTFSSDRFPKDIEWKGGGGTNYRPAFNWVRDSYRKKVSVMIYATDGWCDRFPDYKPPYPVLWGVWDPVAFKPPFGEVLFVE